MSKSFNLTTEPWIKVIDNQNQEQKVSLIEIFQNAQHYRQLAGDMHSQDLSILRFLLAILTTVYSRVNTNDEAYDWLELDEDTWQVKSIDDEDIEDLLDTWKQLRENGEFSEAVIDYLNTYKDRFDLFGEHPFYQATKEEYNSLVDAKKQVEKGKGTVSVKQINRTISESNNSPAIFSPKSDLNKDKIELDQLARWLINYQNFTGVTDKTKVKSKDKFSVSPGWLYMLNPVYIKGNTLFETLLLNLKLFDEHLETMSINQKPVWEYSNVNEYVANRLLASLPDNVAAIYTDWSRVLHVEWKNDRPTIFSAGLPKIDNKQAFIEPMTTWKFNEKDNLFKPAVKTRVTLDRAMWRNFGQYIVNKKRSVRDNGDKYHTPGIILWARKLQEKKYISRTKLLNLSTTGLVTDGNATSQSPYAEFYDDMKVQADVLFDSEQNSWPAKIEDTIDLTQKVGKNYWYFAKRVGQLRGLNDPAEFANRMGAKFYEKLNEPFLQWLASLTIDDSQQDRVIDWLNELSKITHQVAIEFLNSASPSEIIGKEIKEGNNKSTQNIFTLYNVFNRNIAQYLRKEGRKK